ncbi:multiple epidermal growth factor-like domains protein 10, partial [Ostrea edulis]|uniref:multiple epidermal growth factor-like domains protein 10 n=1 Tax=Ostrea edulis TaxID=37623 RepID=UPI0024AF464C
SDRSLDCCPHFYADGDQCVECLAGYKTNKGKNCTEPCDFPSYGTQCQSTCNCSQEDCHHVNGCPVLGTTASPVTTIETTIFSVTGTTSGNSTSAFPTKDCDNTSLKYLIPVVGGVLVVIMIVINIVNIYSYMKDRKEEPIDVVL